jgi:hypothetical protein
MCLLISDMEAPDCRDMAYLASYAHVKKTSWHENKAEQKYRILGTF